MGVTLGITPWLGNAMYTTNQRSDDASGSAMVTRDKKQCEVRSSQGESRSERLRSFFDEDYEESETQVKHQMRE